MKTYAAYYDNKIRMKSSSGGVFSIFANQFDVVYGVAMTEDCYGAEFVRIGLNENDSLAPLRGSKYLQAKVGDTWKKVLNDLERGNSVLVSGTSCQINGLKLFLGKEYDNLICVDVVCHGVPSPKLWKVYAMEQERQNGKICQVDFRCKEDSWKNFGMKENQNYSSKDNNTFMRMFLRNYCLRPSCYTCRVKQNKVSDLTIGDFWGIERVSPEMDDGKGTSLVIVRTKKGERLFDDIKQKIEYKEVSYEDAVRSNSAEYSSVVRPKERDFFFADLETLPFTDMERKYAADAKTSTRKKILRHVKRVVKKNAWGG